MKLSLDHLVVAARTLDEGVDWCAATLGIEPQAGGQHRFMGTHNRVFSIASAAFARAYFEIIAIDPAQPVPARVRWFDLDDAAMQRSLARGPQLVHWVARCDGIEAACATLLASGIDCGEPHKAERTTPQGILRWQISLRADGRRPRVGAVPALIEWGDAHPTDSMADSGVTLEAMRLGGWPEALVTALPAEIDCDMTPDTLPLSVELSGPLGRITLNAPYPESAQ